jgi:hypothetical protein
MTCQVCYNGLAITMMAQGKTMTQYKVPAKFWDDHCARCPCDGDPDIAMAREVSRSGARVLIEGTAAQIEILRSDAAFYAEGNVDDCASLVRSAAATLKALA